MVDLAARVDDGHESLMNHQARLDDRINISSLPALSTALLASQRAVLDPQRQAVTSAQASFIRRLVLHLDGIFGMW